MIRFGIALATCNPNPDFFDGQLRSIREQTFDDWFCVIGDDSSDPQIAAYIQNSVIHDRKFYYFRNNETAGVIGNFERIVERLLDVSEYILLCDQDDLWVSTRLSFIDSRLTSLQRRRSMPTRFINSNMSLIDAGGNVLCPSLWSAERRLVDFANPVSFLFANTVTGCGAIVQSDLIRTVGLPFPRPTTGQIPVIYHDGWLAMCAAALGPIDLIWEPLVAYRQHDNNTVGLRRNYYDCVKDLFHRILHPQYCLGTAKMLLPLLEELSKRVPGRIGARYSWSTYRLIITGAWRALIRMSWSLPEWMTALIGVTLYISVYRIKTSIRLPKP